MNPFFKHLVRQRWFWALSSVTLTFFIVCYGVAISQISTSDRVLVEEIEVTPLEKAGTFIQKQRKDD